MKSRDLSRKSAQLLDLNQANRMQATLRHLQLFEAPELRHGEQLPFGYHLAYFTPDTMETKLGPDGADTTFNPGEPFTRRMWSGGRMTWEKNNPLKLGQTVEELTTLERVESKQTRDRRSMIVVTGKKTYHNEHGLALTDLRSWLFREPSNEIVQRRPVKLEEIRKGQEIGRVTATEITLFRYSALTFNSHRIHYDKKHTQEIEGHPDLVVHGPMNSKSLELETWHVTDVSSHTTGEQLSQSLWTATNVSELSCTLSGLCKRRI